MAQPDVDLKGRLGTFNLATGSTLTRASTFFDSLRADGLVAETLTQNHEFIVIWSATASQGDQLDGLFALGQGIVASGFSSNLLDFFGNTGRGWKFQNDILNRPIVQFFPEAVRVILRCNYQDPSGIPYTIITSFPDE